MTFPHSSRLLRAIHESTWAILPSKLAVLVEIAQRHDSGEKLSAEEVAERIVGARKLTQRISGNIAIVPITGVIVPRGNLMTETSGAVSAERLAQSHRQLMADPNVGAIVYDVDSPGGNVQGVDELASAIFESRGTKPVIAVANHLAASAAYWVATAADELVVTPSGEVGSIGVFAEHHDVSIGIEREGVKHTYISAGKYKTEGNPYEPLGDEARAFIQSRVDDYYELFVKAVARNRSVKVADVRNGFGEGRVVGAKQAVSLGMADRVETLDNVISRLVKQARPTSGRSAEADLEFRQRRARALNSQFTGAVAPSESAP